MATTVDRDLMVELLREEFDALAELGASFDDATWDRPTCLPGWSVKDSLSHIVGTESMLLDRSAPAVSTSHLTHMANPIAEANEAWVESMRARSGAEVLAEFRAVAAERLAVLDAMSQADFDSPSWTPAGPDETYGRFMRIRHFDCFLHELDIRDAAGVADRLDARHIESALSEPAAALGFIVGKKAAVPKGSTVRIELTGPAPTTWFIDVTERATVVDSLAGQPTATIALDALLFLRLAGGRRNPAEHLDRDIAYGGDEALGRQLAANLAYTI